MLLHWLGGNQWELAEPLTVKWRGQTITVPAGTVTDLASVPRLLRWLVPAVGAWTRGSVIHDWAYGDYPQGWSRADADAALYDLSRRDGTWPVMAWLLWAGVRIGGWAAW